MNLPQLRKEIKRILKKRYTQKEIDFIGEQVNKTYREMHNKLYGIYEVKKDD